VITIFAKIPGRQPTASVAAPAPLPSTLGGFTVLLRQTFIDPISIPILSVSDAQSCSNLMPPQCEVVSQITVQIPFELMPNNPHLSLPENFARLEGNNKILLLGGMMELGKESVEEHEAIVKLIEKFNWKQVALVGGDFMNVKHPFLQFSNSTEARKWLSAQKPVDSTILIKGSRSMKMENLMDAFS